MKTLFRKAVSFCMVLVLCLGTVPVWVFAEQEDVLLEGITISGTAFEAYADFDNIGYCDYNTFFMEENAHLSPHRISIWSVTELDASKLSLQGAAEAIGGFTETAASVNSSEYGSFYLYKAPIRISEGGGSVQLLYDGNAVSYLTLQIGTFPQTCIGEAVILSVGQDGSAVIEVSGYNIPEDPVFSVGTFKSYTAQYDPADDPDGTDGSSFIPLYEQSSAVRNSYGVYTVELNRNGVEILSGYQALDVTAYYMILGLNGGYVNVYPLLGEEYANYHWKFPEWMPINDEGGSDEPAVLLPPAISGPLGITAHSVSFSVTPGDYPQMRSRLDSGSWSEWTASQDTVFTLDPEDYGEHIAYFEFKPAEGDIYETSRIFTYSNGTQAPAPESVFLKDNNGSGKKTLTPSGSIYYLTAGSEYLPAAVWGSPDDGIAALEALVYHGSSTADLASLTADENMTLLDMVRVSGTNTYETAQPFTASEGSCRIGVRVKKGVNDAQAGAITEVKAQAQSRPLIYSATVPGFGSAAYISGIGKYMAARNSGISGSFSGTVGSDYRASLVLYYKDSEGAVQTALQQAPVTDRQLGWYSGQMALPEAAAGLVKLSYRIESIKNPENYTEKEYDLSNYILGTDAVFGGIPASYEGAELRLLRADESGSYASAGSIMLGSSGSARFRDLQPGPYKYRIIAESGTLAEGSFAVPASGGGIINIAVEAVPVSDVSITVSGISDAPAGTEVRYRVYYGRGAEDYTSGVLHFSGDSAVLKKVQVTQNGSAVPALLQLYAKTSDGVFASLSGSSVDEYGILSYAMKDQGNAINTSFETAPVKTVTGTVTNALGRAVSSAALTVSSGYETGWPLANGQRGLKTLSLNAVSGPDGKYSIPGVLGSREVLISVDPYVGFGAPAYRQEQIVLAAEETVRNIQLSYRNTGAVTVNLYAFRMGDGEERPGDSRLLQTPQILMDDQELNWNGGENGIYYINDERASAGRAVTVRFKSGTAGMLEGSGYALFAKEGQSTVNVYGDLEQTVTLDANGSGSVAFLAKELGYITAEPAPAPSVSFDEIEAMTDPDAKAAALRAVKRYESYMYVYEYTSGRLVYMTKGRGVLESKKLEDGQYDVLTFYLDTASESYASDLAFIQDAEVLRNRTAYDPNRSECVWNTYTVESGRITEITDRPYRPAGNKLLSGIRFGVTTQVLDGFPGWMQVKVNIMKREPGIIISLIEVDNNVDEYGDALLDAAYLDGQKLERVYGADRYRFIARNVTSDTPYLMFFTQSVRSEGSHAIAEGAVRVTYSSGVQIYDPYREYPKTKEVQTVSVVIDPFDVEVPQTAVFDELNAGSEDFGVVPVHVYGNPGDRITVYDGDRKAAELVLEGIRADIDLKLSDPQNFGTHRIRASRSRGDGSLEYTETRAVSLINRANTIYMNEMFWAHQNDQGLQKWHFHELDEIAGTTIRYWPGKASIITFRLNNVKEGDLANVSFITYYRDTENRFPATLIGSGVDETTGRSWCEYMVDPDNVYMYLGWDEFSGGGYYGVIYRQPSAIWSYAQGSNEKNQKYPLVDLGYFDNFSVEYDLVPSYDEDATEEEKLQAQLEAYYKATAEALPDINNIANTVTNTQEQRDKAVDALPAVLRDGFADGTTAVNILSDNDTNFSYTMENGENGISYSIDMSDVSGYEADDVAALMASELSGDRVSVYTDPEDPGRVGTRTVSWIKYETMQGTIYVRQVKTDFSKYDKDGNLAEGESVDIEYARDTYYPRAVLNAIKNGTTVDVEKAKLQSGSNPPSASLKTGKARSFALFASGSNAKASDITQNESFNNALDKVGEVGTFHGGMDIIQDYVTTGFDAEETAFFKSKYGLGDGFNKGMTVLGIGLTAYGVAKGVQGKDSQTLYDALDSLDMSDPASRAAREALTNEIQSYESTLSDRYMMDTIANGTTTAAGTLNNLNIPVKAGLLLGGIAYNKISGASGEYNDMAFDSIMQSVAAELGRQQVRRLKADKEAKLELQADVYEHWKRVAEFMGWGDIYENGVRITVEERIIREVNAELTRRLGEDGALGYRIGEDIPRPTVLVDPSGYTYEAVPEDRVGGITAELYQLTGSGYVKWEDNNRVIEERQINPQTTAAPDENDPDAGGRYGWMTPYGTFKVLFSDAAGKYADAQTNPMTVPPEHTQVNIGLLSKEVPVVDKVEPAADGTVKITFSKYMQMESLVQMTAADEAKIIGNTDSYDSSASVFTFLDPDGNVIPGRISFPDAMDTLAEDAVPAEGTGRDRVRNTYYKAGVYQKDEIASDWFARSVIFTPDDAAAFDLANTSIRVSKNALSYAGVSMAEEYIKNVPQAEREAAPLVLAKGDVNSDGRVDADDLTRLSRHVAQIETIKNAAQLDAANVDGNSSVDSNDLITLARYVSKIITSFDE